MTGQITFTGHSLGGGLAAMMAVRYDMDATVFNPAPYSLVINEALRSAILDGGDLITDTVAAQRAADRIDVYQMEGEILSNGLASLGYDAAQLALLIAGGLGLIINPQDIEGDISDPFPGTVTTRPYDAEGFSGWFVDILGIEEAINLHAVDLLALMEVRHFANTGSNKLGDLFDQLPTMAGGAIDNSVAGPDNEGGNPNFAVLLRALAYNDAFETVAKEGAYTDYN